MTAFDPYGHLTTPAHSKCTHCGGVATSRDDVEFVKVCNICGAPRVENAEGKPISGEATGLSRKVAALRTSRAGSRLRMTLGALAAGFGTLLAIPLALFSPWAGALAVLFVVAPGIVTYLLASRRAATQTTDIASLVQQAWNAAALELYRTGEASSPAQLATRLGVDEARAQELWTLAQVEAELNPAATRYRVDVPGAGGPRGAVDPVGKTQLRDPVGETLPADERFAELEKRMAQEALEDAESSEQAPADERARAKL